MASGGKEFLLLGVLIILLAAAVFALPAALSLPVDCALGGAILLAVGAVFAGSGLVLKARERREGRLRAEGVPAQARVLDWWIRTKQGGSLDAVESCGFELEVMVEGKPAYRVRHRQLVPFGVYSRLAKGTIVPVRVDRNNPQLLMLDWE